MTWLSKIPVGSARPRRSNDSSSAARSRLARICHTDARERAAGATPRGGRYSRNAGRRRIDGSNGASCVVALDEHPAHLARRDAVREPGGDEAARAHPDVDVEAVEVDAVERFGERGERADLVDARPDGPPPASGEADRRLACLGLGRRARAVIVPAEARRRFGASCARGAGLARAGRASARSRSAPRPAWRAPGCRGSSARRAGSARARRGPRTPARACPRSRSPVRSPCRVCLLHLLVISLTFASASLRVRASRCLPSLTRASNTFAPSSCVFENAPRPASQICCAESRTVDASCRSPAPSASAFSFFTMSNSFRRSRGRCLPSLGGRPRGRTLKNARSRPSETPGI